MPEQRAYHSLDEGGYPYEDQDPKAGIIRCANTLGILFVSNTENRGSAGQREGKRKKEGLFLNLCHDLPAKEKRKERICIMAHKLFLIRWTSQYGSCDSNN